VTLEIWTAFLFEEFMKELRAKFESLHQEADMLDSLVQLKNNPAQ